MSLVKQALIKKISASKLRSMFRVEQKGPGLFQAFVGKSPAGHMRVARQAGKAVVRESDLHEKFQGMGLGKKMYGEVMRRMPSQTLSSDTDSLTQGAERVWAGMKNRGYTASQRNPLWSPPPKEAMFEFLKSWKPKVEGAGPLYSASLPPASAIRGNYV